MINIRNKNWPFIWLTGITLIAVIVPNLIQDGMFMDGMIYATVAKNLANGKGSFWDLHLSASLLNHYRDQPPLTIWITSLFYKVFGNSLYTERIYSFSCSIIVVFLIRSIWLKIYPREPKRFLWWLPVLLYFITPITFWCYQNNMQENTMVIFSLAAFDRFFVASFNKKRRVINSILAGIFLFLAAMCKGVQGIFPFVTPIVFWMIVRKPNFQIGLTVSGIALLSLILLGSFIWFYPPSNEYFSGYFHDRIHQTFNNGSTATTQNRFYLLYRLFGELLVVFIFVLLISVFGRKKIAKGAKPEKYEKRLSLAFFIIAFAGVLPLMVTYEQRGFYLLTALPFLMTGISILISNPVNSLVLLINEKWLMRANYVLLVCVLWYAGSKIGHIRKHSELLDDIYKTGQLVPSNSRLQISELESSNWSLYLYFKRYFGIDVVFSPENYFLMSKSDTSSMEINGQSHEENLNQFVLYRRKIAE